MTSVTMKNWLASATPRFLKPHWRRIEASPLGCRLARGAFWSLAGSLISRGLGLLSGIVVARILGKHDFGQLSMVQSTVGMFGVVAGFGMGLTATKHVAEFRAQDPARAGRIIGLSSLVAWGAGGVMTLVLLLISPWLATSTLASAEMAGLLRAGALLLLLGGINGAQTGALSGFEAFKTIARVNLAAGLLSFPLTLAGAWWLGVLGAVWAAVVCLAVNCILNFIALRQEAGRAGVPLGYRGFQQEWPVLWRFSLPAVCSGLVVSPAMWLCNTFLVNQPDGYGQLGVLNAVYRIKQMPEALLAMVLAPLLPALSDHFGRKQTASYNKVLSLAFTFSAVLIVPISLLQAGWPTLSLLPFGDDFGGHEAVVRAVMLQAILVGLTYPFSNILASMGRMWFGFTYNLGYALLVTALSWWLVPKHGVLGLAIATAATHFLTAVPCVAYIYRHERAFIADTPIISYGIAVSVLYVLCTLVSCNFGERVGLGVGLATSAVSIALLKVHFRRPAMRPVLSD